MCLSRSPVRIYEPTSARPVNLIWMDWDGWGSCGYIMPRAYVSAVAARAGRGKLPSTPIADWFPPRERLITKRRLRLADVGQGYNDRGRHARNPTKSARGVMTVGFTPKAPQTSWARGAHVVIQSEVLVRFGSMPKIGHRPNRMGTRRLGQGCEALFRRMGQGCEDPATAKVPRNVRACDVDFASVT